MSDENRPARLRGHHLICLHFFHGKGYSPEFVVNMMHTLERLEERPGIIVDGADDVCEACPSKSDEKKCILLSESHHEGGIRELDELALELLELSPGDVVDYGDIRTKIPMILKEWRLKACAGCDWEPTCTAALDLVERLPYPEPSAAPTSPDTADATS
jgi:hypothetical protein